MMNKQKSALLIGRRTRTDILNGKIIRKDEEGKDVFEDYWTDTENESSICSQSCLTDISETSNRLIISNLNNSKRSERLLSRQGQSLSEGNSTVSVSKLKTSKSKDKTLTAEKDTLKVTINVSPHKSNGTNSSLVISSSNFQSPNIRILRSSSKKRPSGKLKSNSLMTSQKTVTDEDVEFGKSAFDNQKQCSFSVLESVKNNLNYPTLQSEKSIVSKSLNKKPETLQNLSTQSNEKPQTETFPLESKSSTSDPLSIQHAKIYHIQTKSSKEIDEIISGYNDLEQVFQYMAEENENHNLFKGDSNVVVEIDDRKSDKNRTYSPKKSISKSGKQAAISPAVEATRCSLVSSMKSNTVVQKADSEMTDKACEDVDLIEDDEQDNIKSNIKESETCNTSSENIHSEECQDSVESTIKKRKNITYSTSVKGTGTLTNEPENVEKIIIKEKNKTNISNVRIDKMKDSIERNIKSNGNETYNLSRKSTELHSDCDIEDNIAKGIIQEGSGYGNSSMEDADFHNDDMQDSVESSIKKKGKKAFNESNEHTDDMHDNIEHSIKKRSKTYNASGKNSSLFINDMQTDLQRSVKRKGNQTSNSSRSHVDAGVQKSLRTNNSSQISKELNDDNMQGNIKNSFKKKGKRTYRSLRQSAGQKSNHQNISVLQCENNISENKERNFEFSESKSKIDNVVADSSLSSFRKHRAVKDISNICTNTNDKQQKKLCKNSQYHTLNMSVHSGMGDFPPERELSVKHSIRSNEFKSGGDSMSNELDKSASWSSSPSNDGGANNVCNASQSVRRKKNSETKNKHEQVNNHTINSPHSNQEDILLKQKMLVRRKRKLPKSSGENVVNDIDCASGIKLRTNRQRYAPLAHWRNERLVYRFEKGQIKILGIDEGTTEDKGAVKSLCKGSDFKMKHKRKKSKKSTLYDNIYDRNVTVKLARSFPSVPWDICSPEKPYRIKKLFNTTTSSFGFLEIDSYETKQTQYMPDEDLQMTVMKGRIEVVIQENKIEVSENDMFVVPRSIAYSLRNLGKKRALLSFAVGKFKFLESNI